MLLLCLFTCAPRHPAPETLPPPETELPADPALRSGVLPNGLRWYVTTNRQPLARAELRLVVGVGSAQEDDDQRGLAHVLEHMAFNGTQHYPGNSLISYFESIGMAFGAHVNASTSFNETIYKLTVPTDKPELLDQGLVVLRDQAGGMLLESAEIEKERGVVIEEWRTRQGASNRVFDQTFPLLYAGSRYPERLPIGTEDSLKAFTPEAVKRFYTDWYRPELMAVIAVGDFDPAQVEAQIQAQFSTLVSAQPGRERVSYPMPAVAEPRVKVVTDPELTSVQLSLVCQSDEPQGTTWGSVSEGLKRLLLIVAVNERLADRTRSDRPWHSASVGWSRFTSTEVSDQLSATLDPTRISVGIDAALDEINRAKKYGVTEPELARARATLSANLESLYQGRDTTDSNTRVAELQRAFLFGESVSGIENDYRISSALLQQISQDDVNTFARTWMDGSEMMTLTLPEKPGLIPPTEGQLRETWAAARLREVAPPQADAVDAPLLETLPRPGKIAERSEIPPLGVTRWVLKNGVELWIKPTDFEADQVLLSAKSRGGSSLASDEDYFSASVAATLSGASGMGSFDARSLQKKLAGRGVSLTTGVGALSESLSTRSTVRDLEVMFQLVYLQLTAPRFDPAELDRYVTKRKIELQNRLASPAAVFSDARERVLWGGHLRHRPWTPDDLDRIQIERSAAFFRDRFSDADDLRFVIVGAVDLAALEPLVTRYLGSLPTQPGIELSKDDGARRAGGVLTETVRAGSEPKAIVDQSYYGEFDGGWLARNRLSALEEVLKVRLREVLREDLGGVYGVSVSSSSTWAPVKTYELRIQFSCDPGREVELSAAAAAVVQTLRDSPPTQKEVENIQEMNRREREVDLRSNSFWRDTLIGTWERGEDPLEVLNYDARNNSLSPTVLHEAAQRYLRADQHLKLVLLPAAP